MSDSVKSPLALLVALACLAAFVTACTTPTAPVQEYLLLAPNYGDGTIEVLTADDLVAGGNPSSSWFTSASNGYTGFAYGPDDRLYVSDWSNDAIVVVDGDDMDSDGAVSPAAVITHPDVTGPMGGAFDSEGNLWIGSYNDTVLYRFEGIAGASGSVQIAPSLILAVDVGGGAAPFGNIYDVFVDHMDNVWVADFSTGVYRFDDITSLTGTVARAPDLYLERGLPSAVSDSGDTIFAPTSVFVDESGALYVGNSQHEVARFDDALSLSGLPSSEASAYLVTGIAFPWMVTLDAAGDLWVAHEGGELVKVPNPTTYSGNADVSTDITLQLMWLSDSATGYTDGGTIKFVPR